MNAANRTAINRANAAHSTGPKTVEGRQRASMNALKHGLTGQRLILQPDEHAAYRELTESLHAELRPKTTMELQLVQKIIDTHLRLNRAAALDNNLLNFGLVENCRDAQDGGAEDDDTEVAHAQARSWIAQQSSLEKLGRYEARLSRQLIAYSKELDRLQILRAQKRFHEHMRKDSRRAGRPATQTAANASTPAPVASFRGHPISSPHPAAKPDLPDAA